MTADGKSLFLLLSSQEATDQLVQLYLDNYETTHRILHVPTFRAEYRDFWNAPQDARPAFVAILLAILSVVCCIPGRACFDHAGCSCKNRETAILWIQTCDSWIDLQSHKHTTIEVFQLQCLSLLAKRANSFKLKRQWAFAGDLQRTAMAVGLHLEPILHGDKINVYEREMRARLWATIVELELQASIDRGMPVAFGDKQYTARVPLNIDDEDFRELSKQMPMTKPSSQFTRTAFQHISRSSLPLRIELTSLVNSPGYHLRYEDVLQYDRRIMEFLDALPDWSKDGAHVAQISRLSRLPQAFMSFQLHRFLLLLHRPFAQRGQQNCRFSHSQLACVNAATSILRQYSRLGNITNIAMRLIGDDLFNATLNICFDLFNVSFEDGKRLVCKCFLFEYH